MKLFITDSIFISVIEQENKTFDCLIMEEIHGIGMDSLLLLNQTRIEKM